MKKCEDLFHGRCFWLEIGYRVCPWSVGVASVRLARFGDVLRHHQDVEAAVPQRKLDHSWNRIHCMFMNHEKDSVREGDNHHTPQGLTTRVFPHTLRYWVDIHHTSGGIQECCLNNACQADFASGMPRVFRMARTATAEAP